MRYEEKEEKIRIFLFQLLHRTVAVCQQDDDTETLHLVLLLEQRSAVVKQPKPG